MKAIPGTSSFALGLAAAAALAAVAPRWGSPDGPLPVAFLGLAGVFLIFFNQGVTLPREALRRGALEWRLHGCVQGTTYLMFPLLTGLGLWLGAPWFEQPELRRGFLYLAFLPTTVASAVALTALARGNVAGALFNCTLSSLIGVLLVPPLCVIFLGAGSAGGAGALGGMFGRIALTILLPLVLGQLARRWLNAPFARHPAAVRRTNAGVILFIVWSAFCESFTRGVWRAVGWADLGMTVGGVAALLAATGGWLWWVSARLALPHESRITAFFCGTQKSVAVGLPLSAMIFTTGGTALSLLLLPLLLYHAIQLVVGGWLVPVLSRPG
jgi:sodium/bile acid cotransporter 7